MLATLALAGGQSQASDAINAVAAQTVVNTFSPEADTRVQEALPTQNFGTRVVLRVDGAGDPEVQSYLRFTVSGLAGSVQRATLRLHAIDDTVDGPKIAGTTNTWSEGTMTWNDRPAPTTAAVDDTGAIPANSWSELDVTSLVATDGTFSFVLTATHQNGIDFDSRESTSTSLRPQLVVETLTSNAPVNTSPPTISGAPQEGQTLTAGPGAWNGSQPITFAYQWQRCDATGGGCADVTNATDTAYLLTQSDVGSTFRVVVSAANADGSASATSAPTSQVIGAGDIVITAAGDIASCTSSTDEATAALLDSITPAKVLTLGDHVYPNGTDTEFATCYEPSWGTHKAKTLPAPGNHDYNTPGATGYFGYFGAAAGDPTKGYYAFDLGAWRFYALNSNCAAVPCAAGSAQEQWLRADLAAHPQSCLAAYMHHPRFSSGVIHGSTPVVAALWNALYDYRADLVLQGHDHEYERFTRLDQNGAIDLARGIRSFVVGTGGASLYSFGTPVMGSEARGAAHGVLKLILHDSGYDWTFVPVAGSSFTDSGSDTCGGAPSDPISPSTPMSLVSTTAEAGNVGLAWGESSDAVGVIAYDVFRDSQLLGSTTTTSYTDTSALAGSTYQYYVTARDAAGNDSAPSNTVSVDVTAANRAPAITSNGGGDTASLAAAENQSAVTDVDASDPDVADTLTYAIAGGPDAARFTIVPATGVLTFASAPNFELPLDVGANNVYDVTVSVADGNGGSDTQALAVTVTNVNEFAPVITSDGGGPTAALSRPENQSAVTDVDASDADLTAPSYSIAGGADGARFTIVPATGVLTFVSAPDFEAPSDVGANNVYDVVVQASDGTNASTQALAVTVTDVAEGGGSALYFSLLSQATLAGASYEDEDVVFFDGTSFRLAFDGSDVGLAAFRIDAFSWIDSDSLLLSFEGAGAVPGITGTTDDSDIVRFEASSLGETTAGTFSLFFDGSDVGLTTNAEDVDALELLPSGHLLLSTFGAYSVTGLSGDDKDLLDFSPSSTGPLTAGSYSMYFDGSDVGLTTSAEDVDAAAVGSDGKIYLSTFGNFSVPGISGADEDVVVFTPGVLGSVTTGSYSSTLYFDGSAFGLAANDVVAIDLQ